jgi:hypothetical protein
VTEALLAIIPSISTALFVWLWRRAKQDARFALTRQIQCEKELAVAMKLGADLRVILAQRNVELRECREKLPPAAALDDFFGGLPKRDPGKDNS